QTAAFEGHYNIAKLLLSKNTDPNIQGGMHTTALRAVLYGGFTNVVKLLLDNGASVNCEGGQHLTALSVALFSDHTDICVRLLLDNDADIPATTEISNSTSLHIAIQFRNIYTAQWLLERGADPEAVDSDGLRPLHYAAEAPGKEAFIQLFVRHDVDLNSKTQYDERTAIHNAVCWQDTGPVVKLLLELGATPVCKDKRGRVPLHDASFRANLDIVSSLLNCNASLHDRSKQHWNPLHFAVRFSDNYQTIRLLLEKGADVSAN
ncbi:ankyrin, partial [Wilcoxina mikolae CBS 423.85]